MPDSNELPRAKVVTVFLQMRVSRSFVRDAAIAAGRFDGGATVGSGRRFLATVRTVAHFLDFGTDFGMARPEL
jgi:hypothetical protein